MLTETIRHNFLAILAEELIPAMGCTEPIALAYAAAKGREALGGLPERIAVFCSGNMIKNVRCVRIPNSGGMTGIEAACTLGALAGDADRFMEVLEAVTDDGRRDTAAFLAEQRCSVSYLESPIPLHFLIHLYRASDEVTVEVRHSHTNIVKIAKNGEILFQIDDTAVPELQADRSGLSIENIFAFAEEIDLDAIRPFAKRQIDCNMAIAERGLQGGFGVGIGQAILALYPDHPFAKARAYAAAASEARMDGCDLPVIITSGSGNQGITSTVPVIVYAREKGIDDDRLTRALAFSALLTVYQKEYIGKLSAFCGAVSAACAAGAAITYMVGGSITQIEATIDNTLADIPGIICDGAKASCAAKISSAIDAALFAHVLAMQGKVYESNTGILRSETGETISCVGHIGRVGMQPTDAEIVKMMLRT
ncbi:MAG: serine dehydratase subunit alpha family protein [Ruminococcaceae bacterium]|nr:serine dehydratase subunit alpha family protein [Oscillospiraceae bacterium]